MSEFIFVKPKEGLTILQPDKPHLVIPEEGKRVRPGAYWSRLARQGAIEISEVKEATDEEIKEPVKEKEEPKDGEL